MSSLGCEREALGFDHTELGYQVAKKWNLPEAVCDTIRDHHAVHFDTPHAPVVACVTLANVMCSTEGLRSVDIPISRISPAVVDCLGLGLGSMKSLVDDMRGLIGDNQPLLELAVA